MTDLERAELQRDLVYAEAERDLRVNKATQKLAKTRLNAPNADHSALKAEVTVAHTYGKAEISRLHRLLSPPEQEQASVPPSAPPPAARPAKLSTTTPPFVFSAIALLGALIMAWSGWALLQSQQTLQWAPTPGVITTSEMTITRVGGQRTVASADFAYQYVTDNVTHTSSVISTGGTQTSGPSRWNVGDEVTVYVNPEEPTESVLITGSDPWNAVQFGVGLVLMVFGGVGRRRTTPRQG